MKRLVLVIALIFVVLCVCVVVWGEESIVVLGKSERGEDVPNPTWEMAHSGWLDEGGRECRTGSAAVHGCREETRDIVHGVLPEGCILCPEL